MAIIGPKTTIAAVFIGPFIVACMLGIGLVYLLQLQVQIFHVNDTIRVTGKPATVSYTISTPVTPSATTLDGTTYTLIRPTSSYTRVHLGSPRGFDTSTFGPKTLDYTTSSKPHLNSGRPYTLRHLPKYMTPPAIWRFGM
ncbi:non-structural protein ns4 [Murine coronavirus MHV-1]|uniref:Non-structural protein ns4 n=2 Tax=Murine hepatitis virus TaxID=11138 RepID=C0KYW2_9BETC|nr:unknown [Murine hepatitis virus]ACN89734.1 non-structural protein ns4 [Murine coronavirus MHV-1]